MSDHEFQTRVIADLSELKTNMKALIGNGKPGRIDILEKQTARNTKYINYGIGVIMFVGALLKLFL